MLEINSLFESCVIALDQQCFGSTAPSFQKIAAVNSFMMSAIAVVAGWLKMGAEETYVLWLDRDAEQLTHRSRGARDCRVAAPFSTEIRAILANPEARMRPTRSYRGQHLMQGLVHRSSLFRVERVDGPHQNFERIARECFVTLVGQSQTDASPVRFGSLSDQIPTCLKCLDGLRRGATGGRLKRRECRRGPGERIGAGEVAERHPLGGTEFAVIALGLHKPPRQQQELCRFACCHGHLAAK